VDDGKEIDSAVIGEAAAAAASAAGAAGVDAAAVAAKADAAVPVASEPSASARFIRALPVRELPAGGALPAPAALAAGGVCAAEGEDVCESARPLPAASAGVLAGAGVFAEAAPLMPCADSEFVSAATAGAAAASDCDFGETAAMLAAGGALLDGGVADAAVELTGPAPEAAELSAVIAGPKTAPCAACVVSSEGMAEPAVETPAVDAPATGTEAAAAPPTGDVVSPEPPSPASSRIEEGTTGAPLAGGRSGGSESSPAGTATGAAAAGGAPLPCGNVSPLDLPLAGPAESSFRLCLTEARSSARAKARAPPAL
jgi:hypothetical protein